MKRGKWSKEEDDLMKNHIEKYGIGRGWQTLAQTLGLQRCARSCRSRWLNYLRPGLKHGNFTPAEESTICDMYSKRGSCWSVIAAQLPGRTDQAVKNYWNSTISKRLHGASSSRHRPSSSTTSDARTPDELPLVVHDEESTTTGSSSYAGGFVVNTPFLAGGWNVVAKEEVGESEWTELKPDEDPAPLLENAPAPPDDQAGEMDMVCDPMSPIPLAFMEPDMPWVGMSPIPLAFMEPHLPWIGGFDEIDSFLPWFDDR